MRASPLLVAILSALPACSTTFEDEGCMVVAEEHACLPPDKVSPSSLFLPNKCGDDLEIVEVNGGGVKKTLTGDTSEVREACCYPVTVIDHNTNQECAVGRPYTENGKQLRAPLRARGQLGPALDAERAAAWASAGAEEHASVAAFARLSLELMALGAPTELLRGVHQAALDEIHHAERCWSVARHFGAQELSADAFPFAATVALCSSLAELAAAAARDGCLTETLGAHLIATAAEHAPEPVVKAALEALAAEEERHAVLSFRIVAWALAVGGEPVRAAVRAAFAEPWPVSSVQELALRANVDASLLEAASAQGIAEVLRPATAALLAA